MLDSEQCVIELGIIWPGCRREQRWRRHHQMGVSEPNMIALNLLQQQKTQALADNPCCNQFSAYKIKQSNSPSSGSQERFISRPVLKNNYGDQDMAHSKLPPTHFVSKFNYAFTIHLSVFEYRDTEDF